MAGISYRRKLVDSHLNLAKKTEDALTDFFMEVKGLGEETAREEQAHFCDWFEKEHAVKWFEVITWQDGKVVGYLRCLRNPLLATEWFIGDVHVRKVYRRQGIATRMYEKAISTVMKYEAAEQIVSSVHPDNGNSIKLHEKMGFQNTGQPCDFPTFYFDEKETEYCKVLYQYFPIPKKEEYAVEILLPLYRRYLMKNILNYKEDEKAEEKTLRDYFEKASKGELKFEAIWCGNRLVGFHYQEKDMEITYLEEKK